MIVWSYVDLSLWLNYGYKLAFALLYHLEFWTMCCGFHFKFMIFFSRNLWKNFNLTSVLFPFHLYYDFHIFTLQMLAFSSTMYCTIVGWRLDKILFVRWRYSFMLITGNRSSLCVFLIDYCYANVRWTRVRNSCSLFLWCLLHILRHKHIFNIT